MSEIPDFNSVEEMEEWLKTQEEKGASTSTSKGTSGAKKGSSTSRGSKNTKASGSSPKKKRSRKKLPAKPDEGTQLTTETLSEEFTKGIWSTVHFYQREFDSIQSVRQDAKDEAKFRNENVLVFYHEHFFGQECTKLCGRIE